jgi:hypothetical protein
LRIIRVAGGGARLPTDHLVQGGSKPIDRSGNCC